MMPVVMKVLPGESLGGSGKIRIHWFCRDEAGPQRTPEGKIKSSLGMLTVGGVRGYIACQPNRDTNSRRLGGAVEHFHYTDEPTAATCPECLASEACKNYLAQRQKILGGGEPAAAKEG